VLVKLSEMDLGLDLGLNLDPSDPAVAEAVAQIKAHEAQGYAYEGAEGSFLLLLLKAMKRFRHYFELEGFRIFDEKQGHEGQPVSEATVRVSVGGRPAHAAALGNGPINAMDNALRAALFDFYPNLKAMRLTDFKVRVLTTKQATRAAVRVLIESSDGVRKWGTVGVSEDIIEAGYRAMVDAIEYKLLLDQTPYPASAEKEGV
jgi:2-isopropylmalate synthase